MSVKQAILGLLHYQDMHGYRIKCHLEQHFGHLWSINYGQIYPNLKKLEREGLVAKREIPQARGPARKLYSITPAGRAAFSEWLASEPNGKMLMRDPFLLRFVFFGFGRKDRALDLIDQQIRLYETQLEIRRSNLLRWKGKGIYVRQVAELGLLINEMYLEWLKRTRAVVAKQPDRAFASGDPGLPMD